jgi:four helix bundle protein
LLFLQFVGVIPDDPLGNLLGSRLAIPLGMADKPYDIRERTYLFTRDVIAFGRQVVALRDFVLNRLVHQLVDAAGSVGSNLEEALAGQSRPDFISKNSIALKELREAGFWLRQLRDAEPKKLGPVTAPVICEAEELKRIVATIVLNAKQRRSK